MCACAHSMGIMNPRPWGGGGAGRPHSRLYRVCGSPSRYSHPALCLFDIHSGAQKEMAIWGGCCSGSRVTQRWRGCQPKIVKYASLPLTRGHKKQPYLSLEEAQKVVLEGRQRLGSGPGVGCQPPGTSETKRGHGEPVCPGRGSLRLWDLRLADDPIPSFPASADSLGTPVQPRDCRGSCVARVSLSPPLRLSRRRRRSPAGGGARAQERRSRCRGYLHLGGGRGGGPGREAEARSVSRERGRLPRLAASSRLPGAPEVRGGPPNPRPPAAPAQRAPVPAGP